MFWRQKQAQGSEPLPVYMHEVELSQLRAITAATRPKHWLEWGSGGSTRAFLTSCDFIESYVSVEHDPEWHAEVQRHVNDPRLLLQLVLPDVPRPPSTAPKLELEAWDLRAEHDPAMMKSYVAFPRTLKRSFDFVLVDGRARNFGLVEGFDLLSPGGVLVLHDAQRDEDRETLRRMHATFLEPWYQGQVCLLKKP